LLVAPVILALALSACGGRNHDDDVIDPIYDWTALDAKLDSFLGAGGNEVLGYAFSINVNGRKAHTRSGGIIGGDTVLPIASASKAPSATVILTLVEQGLIELDLPVSAYIGSDITWPVAKAAITMRMLLNHTSGLPFDSDCMSDDDTTLKACADEIGGRTLSFRPGLQFGYSGAGYQLAGYIAEKVTGKSWATLVQERLTEPLGMSTFSYGDTRNPRIGGGASSNAEDYLKFTQMWLNNGVANNRRILRAETIALGRTNQIAGRRVFYTPVPSGSGLNGYSFGWWISDKNQHPGSNGPELSDPGLLGTTPWLDFDKGYTAIVLITSTTDVGLSMWKAARPLIREQIDPPVTP